MKMKKLYKRTLVIFCSLLLGSIVLIFCLAGLNKSDFSQAYVTKTMEQACELYNIPAVSVTVMNSEDIIYNLQKGTISETSTQTITDQSYFHIGSCSKSMLAYIAAKLVEDGLIKWDTRFFDLFPELREDSLEQYANITLENLLTCRAGIKPYASGEEVYPDLSAYEDKELEFVKYLLKLEPSAEKDAKDDFKFLYSNAGYEIAYLMLKEVSGLGYDELLEQYIEEDLGLDVYVGWPYELNKAEPWGHYLNSDKSLIVVGPDSGYELNPLIEPSGDLSMSSEDFSKYVQLQLRGMMGRSESLKRESFEYLNTKYKDFSFGSWNDGMVGKTYICFDGTIGTYFTRGIIVPGSDYGFTIMINNGSEEAIDFITMRLAKAYYGWDWMFWL